MTTNIQPIRDAMDAYLACDDGVSGYVLLVALRDAVRVAVSEIATRSGCQVSDEVAGTSSYYITISREYADGETDVDVKVRVSSHKAAYANDWSFEPGDSDKSITMGLARIEDLCR